MRGGGAESEGRFRCREFARFRVAVAATAFKLSRRAVRESSRCGPPESRAGVESVRSPGTQWRIRVSATIIATALRKGLVWLATRGKGVSKHIGNHSRKAGNLARKNPRFAARAMGRSAHSMFADPRPRKLIQKVL